MNIKDQGRKLMAALAEAIALASFVTIFILLMVFLPIALTAE